VVRVRQAEAGEAQTLTALCLRSKAHWGYDAEFMRLCVPSLTVSEDTIAEGRVLVATDDGNQVIGTASVLRDGDDAELGFMTILADVNAAPFYERMGARFLRRMPSDAIPGRTLPFYEYDLAERAS